MLQQDDLKNKVGGQAVMEGVMMRSPNSFAVVVRRPDGQIVIREQRWVSLWKKLKFLRWPFFRGSVVLVESMMNGLGALTFSANHALEEEDEKGKDAEETTVDADGMKTEKARPVLSTWALMATIAVSFLFAIALFVVVPHALTFAIGYIFKINMDVDTVLFHAIDGAIKMSMFIVYVWAISMFRDIRRVFQYHGAEHMTIFAHEQGKDLTVENVRPYSTYHPRCGTSFIMIVLLASILLFTIFFSLLPKPEMNKYLLNAIYIAIKIPLLLPIAGISYEFIKLAGSRPNNPILRLASLPGLWLQRITTKKPDDSQLEIAILSLKKCLWREYNPDAPGIETVRYYPDFETASKMIDGEGHPQTPPKDAAAESA